MIHSHDPGGITANAASERGDGGAHTCRSGRSSPLLSYWEERGARILKRADVLGMVTEDRRTVAVAGTHGKTTVSTMIAHLLTVGKVQLQCISGWYRRQLRHQRAAER